MAAIVFLQEVFPDTGYVSAADEPHYRKPRLFSRKRLPIDGLPPESLPLWRWDKPSRRIVRSPEHIVTPAIREKAVLAQAKARAIERIMLHLSIARYSLRTGVELQEIVYVNKRTQAEKFRDSGYDESSLLEYPHVLNYADFAGISLREAADTIILKAKLDDQLLAKTELLRLRYFKNVADAKSVKDLSTIIESFFRDCYWNAAV